jgi:RNA polymerase sigma factor (sigma-70 family)
MNEMQPKSDAQLLREYAEHGSEPAFNELVTRYTNLVYSVAARQMESPDAAAEVAQNVFIGLARAARPLSVQLAADASLAGWLCRTARNISLNCRRNDFRRCSRERQAMEQINVNSEAVPEWQHLRPVLDEVMAELTDADHDALVMRFFDNQDLRSVGRALGVTDDTAQKRVARALEKLREQLSRRGISTTAGALSVVVSANAVQTAPAGLAASISTAVALAGGASFTSTAIAATKTIVMTTFQKTVILSAIAVAVGTGIFEGHQISALRGRVRTLEAQQLPLEEQDRQMMQQRKETERQLAVLQQENDNLRSNLMEVPKLRSEVAQLRRSAWESSRTQSNASANGGDSGLDAAFKAAAARASLLKQRLEQMPDHKIPELQLLTDKDWFAAAKRTATLDTDSDFRRALADLRNSAKFNFDQLLQVAMAGYCQANGGQLPTDLSQLKPYFSSPMDDAILQRYSLLQTGKVSDVPPGQYLVAETAPAIDPEYDHVHRISYNGVDTEDANGTSDAVKQATVQFAEAHNGSLPADSSQLIPYFNRPMDPAKVQDILLKIPPGITTLDQLKKLGGF